MAEVEYDPGKHKRFMKIAGHDYRLLRIFDDATQARVHGREVQAHFEDVQIEFIHDGEWGVLGRPQDRYPGEVW